MRNKKTNREVPLTELKQSEITPEAIEADKNARCKAAQADFQELCEKHRVTFVPIIQIVGTQLQSDFMIVAK